MNSPPTVFVDRDGVVNRRPYGDWVSCWADFDFLPGSIAGLQLIKSLGCRTVLISNQRGIAIGRMSLQQLEELHARMQLELGSGAFDAIHFCPHDDKDGCDCRKPLPGMFHQAVRRFPDIKLAETVMLGDRDIDRQAAAAAGCGSFILVTKEFTLLDAAKELASRLRTSGKLLP